MYLADLASAIRREVPDDALPDGDTSELFLIYAVLLLAKGTEVTRADVHNAWVAWAAADRGTHDALVPFDELDADTQAEDSPYVIAIRTVAHAMQELDGRRGADRS